MSTIKNNTGRLFDHMIVRINCSYCPALYSGWAHDAVEFAEDLDRRGWVVNRSDKVKCPICVKKMSK